MPDLAELNLVIRSGEVVSGSKNLDSLTRSAGKAEGAVSSLGRKAEASFTQTSAATGRARDAMGRFVSASVSGTAGINSLSGATSSLSMNSIAASNSVMGLGAALTSIAAISASVAGAFKALQVSAQFEQTTLAFETMLGSAEKADAALKEIISLATKSPFQVKGLADTTRLMLAMGFNIEQAIPMLKTMGNAVSALGGNEDTLKGVALALGQMQAKGKVAAQEMNQMAERGISSWKYLADALGMTIPEAMKAAESGSVSAARAIPEIMAGMANDPKFTGAMEKMSQTLGGLWSTFKDVTELTLRDIGDALVESFDLKRFLKELIEELETLGRIAIDVLRIFNGLPPKFRETAEAAESIVFWLKALEVVLVALLAAKIVEWIGAIAKGLGVLVGIITKLNPWLTALTVLFGVLVTYWREIKEFFGFGSKEVTTPKVEISGMKDIEQVSRVAQEQEQATRRAAAAQERLNSLMADAKTALGSAGISKKERERNEDLATFTQVARNAGLSQDGLNQAVSEYRFLLEKIADAEARGDRSTAQKKARLMLDELQADVAMGRRQLTVDPWIIEAEKRTEKYAAALKEAGFSASEAETKLSRFQRSISNAQKEAAAREFGDELQELNSRISAIGKTQVYVEIERKVSSMGDTIRRAFGQNTKAAAQAVNQLTEALIRLNSLEAREKTTQAFRDLATRRGAIGVSASDLEISDATKSLRPLFAQQFPKDPAAASRELARYISQLRTIQTLESEHEFGKALKDLQEKAHLAGMSEDSAARFTALKGIESLIKSASGGDGEKAAKMMSAYAAAYDQMVTSQKEQERLEKTNEANKDFRFRIKGLDEELRLARLTNDERERAQYLMEANDEIVQAFGENTEQAAEAVALLAQKLDEIKAVRRLTEFTENFAQTLGQGIEDALFSAITGGDWKEALRGLLMTLARQAFSFGFQNATATSGGNSNIFLDLTKSVFGAATGVQSPSPGQLVQPGQELQVQGLPARSMQVVVYNVPDEATADALASRASSRGAEAIVAKGSGVPGMTAGSLRPRRRR